MKIRRTSGQRTRLHRSSGPRTAGAPRDECGVSACAFSLSDVCQTFNIWPISITARASSLGEGSLARDVNDGSSPDHLASSAGESLRASPRATSPRRPPPGFGSPTIGAAASDRKRRITGPDHAATRGPPRIPGCKTSSAFTCPPKTFDKHVVQCPTTTVHAHRYPRRLQPTGKRLGGQLHPLIGVEDLGPSPGPGPRRSISSRRSRRAYSTAARPTT